jgi:hypothetical protein
MEPNRPQHLSGSMSQLGQSRHFDRAPLASALPPTPDILSARRHVSKVPKGDIRQLNELALSCGPANVPCLRRPGAFLLDRQLILVGCLR